MFSVQNLHTMNWLNNWVKVGKYTANSIPFLTGVLDVSSDIAAINHFKGVHRFVTRVCCGCRYGG